MEKSMLDNMTGQELKEMIEANTLVLDELNNSALEKIMNYEIDMLCLGTGDMMTIRRCSELLNERNSSEKLSREKVVSVIAKAENDRVVIVDGSACDPKSNIMRPKRVILRRVGLVAAVLASVMAMTALVAAAFGVDVFGYIRDIVRLEDGTVINEDGFTFYNAGVPKEYTSIEEMIKSEDLDIMYPAKLPEGVKIKKVEVVLNERGNDWIGIITNDINVSISIEKNVKESDGWLDSEPKYEKNGVAYHIVCRDGVCGATTYYNGDCYNIKAKNYEDLILMIDSTGELK